MDAHGAPASFPPGAVEAADVAGDLVRSAIGRDLADLDDVTVTRTLYHRHLRWRRSTRLHWSETCAQMSGRSPVSRRTVQFSTTDSEQLNMVCAACRPRRSSTLVEVLTAASLTELVDHYARAGDYCRAARGADHQRSHQRAGDTAQARHDAACARRHARRSSELSPVARPIRDAVDARRALPLGPPLLDRLSVQLWWNQPSEARRTLETLGVGDSLQTLRQLPLRGGAARHSHINQILTQRWPQVPAGALGAVTLAADGTDGAYASLQNAWLHQSRQAALAWLQERDSLLGDRQRGLTQLALSSVDLNDVDAAEQYTTPSGVAVCTHHHNGLRLYSMALVAAHVYRLLLPAGSFALVGDDSSDTRELGLLALTLSSDRALADLADALDTARAAWSL